MKINNSIKARWYNKNKRSLSSIKFIVVHYTANSGTKATAKGNANYFHETDRKASAHYIVDESETVYQAVDDAYPAYAVGDNGTGKYKDVCSNANSISIEMVSHSKDGVFYIPKATLQNTYQLVRILMKRYNIDINHVIRHYDVTAKACPKTHINMAKWNDFKKNVVGENEMKKKLNIVINGEQKVVNAIENNGYNYIKLQDLRNDKIMIEYDANKKMPIINTK